MTTSKSVEIWQFISSTFSVSKSLIQGLKRELPYSILNVLWLCPFAVQLFGVCCSPFINGPEDVQMAQCLQNIGVDFVDSRDVHGRLRYRGFLSSTEHLLLLGAVDSFYTRISPILMFLVTSQKIQNRTLIIWIFFFQVYTCGAPGCAYVSL